MRFLSLFSGVEAASLAWLPLGWRCVAVAEIEPAACSVLARHWPDVPNLGDVRTIDEVKLRSLGRFDLVVGGSPCQDLSVAGRRQGINGARSRLFHEQVRVFDAARTICGARFLLWENVEGALRGRGGGDFACVVSALAGCDIGTPVDGWCNEGLALGPRGLVEWSVLDAQWFGVAQRRRRVFALLDSGDWTDRPPVFFESERVRGRSAPRRTAGEAPAAAVDARASGASADGAGDVIVGAAPVAIDVVSPALKARDGKGPSSDGFGDGAPLIPVLFDARQSDVLIYGDIAGPLDTCAYSQAVFAPRLGVRRLLPVEAERLQGFPDNHTALSASGTPISDRARFRLIGNSIAVPVLRWIGRKLEAVLACARQQVAWLSVRGRE